MSSRRIKLVTFASLLLLMTWVPAALAQKEIDTPGEEALWHAAGNAFEAGNDKSAALQQYRLFVSSYGGSERAAEAQYMIGECYFAIGDYEAALVEYKKVGDRNGQDKYLKASVLLRIGESHFNLTEFDEALQAWNKLLDEFEDSFLVSEALYASGLVHIVQQNFLKLNASYKRLLESRPGYGDMPQVKFALGLFAYQEKRYEDAIRFFSDVPSDRGLYYLGRTMEEMGQYILAIQRYKQVLRQYPDSPLADDVAFSIADAFYRSGQSDVAVRSYRSFLEDFPNSPFVPNARYKMACVTYQAGNYDESIRQLSEICETFRDDIVCAYAGYLVGDCYMHLQNRASAIFAYTDILKRFPETTVASAALHKIVYAYVEDANYAQAVQLAQEFVRRYPGDPLLARVRVLEGFAQYQLGDYGRAIMAFQNVLDRHVNTEVAERALFLSTMAYHQEGELDRLITNYRHIASRLLPTPSYWRARTYFQLGEAYYSQGLYREAEGMYRLVLTGYPRSNVAAASLQGLVASLSTIGEYDLALQEQQRFLLALANADSDEGTNSLAVGSIYFNQSKYEEALAQFQDFLAKHPDDPEAAFALMNAGDCYYRLQFYEQAVESWNQLLRRFPDSSVASEALYRIADTYFGLGDFQTAKASYARLQAKSPTGKHAADAAFGLANCAYNLGQDDAAIAAFGSFLQMYPKDVRVEDAELGIQSCYYRSGKDMEEYLQRNPDSALAADVYWNQGQDAFASGDLLKAARNFERVTLDYPDSESGAGALYYLAESYYRLEEWQQSLAGYRNFITTHPSHDLVEISKFRAGTVLFQLERYAEAADQYESLRDVHPHGEYAALASYNASIAYQKIEDWPAAIGALMLVLHDYPESEKSAGVWLQIAAIYQQEMGSYDDALKAYDEALARGEASPAEIHYQRGQCLEKLNRLDDAIAIYRSAADSGGSDPFVLASLNRIAEIHEERHDWAAAVAAYQQILRSGAGDDWISMAQARIEFIQEERAAGR
jgi:tetratricopeptide (TPR) repeat protein